MEDKENNVPVNAVDRYRNRQTSKKFQYGRGSHGLGVGKGGNSGGGLMQRLVQPFRKSTSSLESAASGRSSSGSAISSVIGRTSDSDHVPMNIQSKSGPRVSFVLDGSRRRERTSGGSVSSGTGSLKLGMSTGANDTGYDSAQSPILDSNEGGNASFGRHLLTYPLSVGVTPAREKALARISEMNHKGLENRVAKKLMAAQIRKRENAELAIANKRHQSDDEGENICFQDVDSMPSPSPEDEFVDDEFVDDDPEHENEAFSGANKMAEILSADHPIFGQLLADFEYKRVFRASGRQLCASVPIWHLQRPTDPKRVAALVANKRTRCDFQGVISIFDFDESVKSPSLECPQKTGVFDGQHRLLAINELLKEQTYQGGRDIDVLIEVYPVRSEGEVKRLFQDINKAEMVQEIDLPNHLAGNDKVIIDEACAQLHARYSDMFKGERCRAPHVNLAALRNELFTQRATVLGPVALDVGTGATIKCAADLLVIIEQCNARLKDKPRSFWPKGLQRNLPKAERNGFYLGMTKDWVHTVLGPLRVELANTKAVQHSKRKLSAPS